MDEKDIADMEIKAMKENIENLDLRQIKVYKMKMKEAQEWVKNG